MTDFTDFMRQRLTPTGYRVIKQTADDLFLRSPDDNTIWVMYLNAVIEPEQIRRAFDFQGHVLFVVNEKLIPDEIESREATPMWLRVLHGLYMGRVYIWNGRGVYGLHFDYDTGEVSESPFIQFDELLLVETGTWLRGWPGTFKLARFWDRAWWTDGNYEYYTNPRGTWNDYRREQSGEDFRRQYQNQWTPPHEEQARQQSHNTRQERAYYTPPKQGAPKEDFMRQFATAGSPSAVKALFRALAKKYHPDLNPGVDTTQIMQEINAAYERWR